MFSGILPNNIDIFATTAANSTESSYACYYDDERETYLGDVYSVNWLEDSDGRSSLTHETLQQQFNIVLKETNTSHVMEFGDRSISRLHVSQFQGSKTNLLNGTNPKVPMIDAIPSGDVPLSILHKKLLKSNTENDRYLNRIKYDEMIRSRMFLANSVKRMLQEFKNLSSVESVWQNRVPIENHGCYISLIKKFDEHCFDLSTHPFALRFLYVFVNLCETLDDNQGNERIVEDWVSSMVQHCTHQVAGHPFKSIL